MKTRTLGKTGYQVSEIGLGTWQLGNQEFGNVDDAQANEILTTAAAQQINFWDTADVYGNGTSEQRIGNWLAQHDHSITVATKVGRSSKLYPNKYTRDEVRAHIEASLQRLQTDCLDLIQLHCIPFEEMKAGDIFNWLDDFKQQGLIRHYGASVETVEEALFCLQQPDLATLQIIFNLFRQDPVQELLPKAKQNNVGIIVRLPLASGVLSGKFTKSTTFEPTDHRSFNRDGQAFNVGETFSGLPFETAVELAEQLKPLVPDGMNMAQMALRWILDQPAVSTVIAGATKPEQVVRNTEASELPALSHSLHDQLGKFYWDHVRQHVRGQI